MHLLASPPGLHGDAARLGPYALDFLKRCLWPFYIHHQFAPHPLITYLQAPLFAAFGFGLALLRGATALAAALAAPAAYVAWREIVAEGGFDSLLVPERLLFRLGTSNLRRTL